MERYEGDLWEFEQQQEKIDKALAFLKDRLDPLVRNQMCWEDGSNPKLAWDRVCHYLEAYKSTTVQYPPRDPHEQQVFVKREHDIAVKRLADLRLDNCRDLHDFFTQFDQYRWVGPRPQDHVLSQS
jgi:hypothetical protein